MNPPFGLTQVQFIAIAIGVVAVAFLGFFGGRVWMLRRRDARRVARLTSGAADFLRNVLVPDGNGGDYHLDFVLLTSRGLVIIDMRDIIGNVFGGDQMTDWTLMDGARRTTFTNPQSGLYDRIASVKATVSSRPMPENQTAMAKAATCPSEIEPSERPRTKSAISAGARRSPLRLRLMVSCGSIVTRAPCRRRSCRRG